MTVEDVRRRVDRLAALAMGLHREYLLMKRGNDPLLRLERQAYLQAVRKAIDGAEAGRVILVKAWRRMDRQAG